MNLMTVATAATNWCPSIPVPAENQDSHRNASEEPAAVLLEIRRMPIEFLHEADEACGICRLRIFVRTPTSIPRAADGRQDASRHSSEKAR